MIATFSFVIVSPGKALGTSTQGSLPKGKTCVRPILELSAGVQALPSRHGTARTPALSSSIGRTHVFPLGSEPWVLVPNAFPGETMTKENVAIILAVSDYGPANSLPACRNDGTLIRRILEKSGKYAPDNVLHIDADTSSSTVKAALSRFIGGLTGREVGEVFFFYTGHGLF